MNSSSIKLAVDMSFFHTDFLWMDPGGWQGHRYYDPTFYEDAARTAARGVFDLIFFGEAAETPESYGGDHRAAVEYGIRWPKHDMMPMIPVMARAAENVGFGITMSTTYHHPFHVARLFASLDWQTGGRMAWNSVTSAFKNEGANWGFDPLLPKDERYAMAHEHMEVVAKLWASVEADALVYDRASGRFADPDKVTLIHHRGDRFSVRGPLPVLPSPQGHPVVIQAGQTGPGLDLAGRFAQMQFAINRTVDSMRTHRAGLDEALARHGRKPADCGVWWAIRAQVCSPAEAERRDREFMDRLPPFAGRVMLSSVFGVDFSTVDGRTPLGEFVEQVKAQRGHFGIFEDAVRTSDPATSVEEFGRAYFVDQAARVVGTPAQIADQLMEMHEATGENGGFMLEGAIAVPRELVDFVDFVVPELQRRGVMKREYAGSTLRANLEA
ncbi:NtaA/DmoA family FMN-dependent monooxygenase [Pseudonocardia xishanensis]|uniref:NtaA/DmoA family FMN-dependent monooxygenase n=1 Tax=Pseudonocardia xishanensis TaxID=630995 RepID=A0ABP8S2Z4_9PSEU